VLTAATRLADLADASLVVFRALGVPPDMPPELLALSEQRREDSLVHDARADLERRTCEVPPSRIERIITEVSPAWDGIWRFAAK
jgi:hypothetical protein